MPNISGGLMTPELQATADHAHIPVLSKPFGAADVTLRTEDF